MRSRLETQRDLKARSIAQRMRRLKFVEITLTIKDVEFLVPKGRMPARRVAACIWSISVSNKDEVMNPPMV